MENNDLTGLQCQIKSACDSISSKRQGIKILYVVITLKIGFKNNTIFVMTKTEVINVLSKVEHPAIRYSLIKLGIVTEVELTGNNVKVVFAFPFPNIPIADFLIQSVAKPIKHLGLEFEYTTRVMNDEERNLFLQLETEAWKG